MQDVFAYIISLGAAVMMPIIFSILGLLLGIKPGKAVLSGLYVGVGFVGLSIITALLTSSLGPGLNNVVEIYDLKLKVFDMGWPAAASVAYNTAVGALIIPVCLGVNIVLLLLRFTKTVNIDLWNYWHFAFIGAIVYFASGNLYLGFFAAIICYIITLVMADLTAKKFQNFYDNMDGISIPQPFCQGMVPFAIVINKVLDKIPGFDKLYIDAEGMKKKFGLLGEPLFLGIVIGAGVGVFARYDFSHFFSLSTFGSVKSVGGASFMDNLPYILGLGIKMGAVMELIPRITRLFIEGLMPISDATRKIIAKKFQGKIDLNIGMTPALVIGHPTTLVVSLLLIPVTLLMAVFLPGNEFLPLASLAGMFYLFPLVLPITNGNVVKSFIVGLVVLVVGLYFVTDLAPSFTLAARDVYAATGDSAVNIPEGFQGGALDFASSIFTWIIFHATHTLGYIGEGILVLITLVMLWYNRRIILKEHNDSKLNDLKDK
ncbi:PTS sugar transporter subunit IIC [Weeksellaceae bacterium TAE3-ERU29]|nr:PTS sugar transporter subunit IIC [Weeksellaceae bacterium TAE3-ERU29]